MTFSDWKDARNHAEQKTRELRIPHGIEKRTGPLDRGYAVFMLPRPENRTGHELRCEVVECADVGVVAR